MPRWKDLPEELDPQIKEFTQQVRRLVDRSGLSVAALADRTGYSKTSWERYLGGRLLAPKGAIVALAEVTGTNLVHLTTMWELAERAWSRAEMRHDRTMEAIRISQARAALGEFGAAEATGGPSGRKGAGAAMGIAGPAGVSPTIPTQPTAPDADAREGAGRERGEDRDRAEGLDRAGGRDRVDDSGRGEGSGRGSVGGSGRGAADGSSRGSAGGVGRGAVDGSGRGPGDGSGSGAAGGPGGGSGLGSAEAAGLGTADGVGRGPADAAGRGLTGDAGPGPAGRDGAGRGAASGANSWGLAGYQGPSRASARPGAGAGAGEGAGAGAGAGATAVNGARPAGSPEGPGRTPGTPDPYDGRPAGPGPTGGGTPAPGKAGRQRVIMFLAGLVGVLVVIGAVFFLTDRGGAKHENAGKRPSPSATAHATLPPGVKCAGSACDGKDAETMGCSGELVTTAKTATVGTTTLEVRYSKACGTAWGRITGAAQGDQVQVSAGKARQTGATSGPGDTIAYTPMVAVKNAAEAKACATLASGRTGCTK
ncbi:helix-turn-helix domain-containing protein [Streptomyces puniciscabiei]|uniref:helix-turn-helix domain-containing protein n=1 Tax=Streptomyces puniciscabiei TaxID=164348 RepID=UPI003331ED52